MIQQRTGQWVAGRVDLPILIVTVALIVAGLVAVYSASFVLALAKFGDSHYYLMRQLMWAFLGAVLMATAASVDYHRYRVFALPAMAATIVALIAVLVIGVEGNGARRWIGAGAFTVQPSEFAKVGVIVYVSAWLAAKKSDSLRSFAGGLVPFVVIISAVAILIILQPNLGTALVLLMVTVTMFWVAGASFAQMATLMTTGIVVIGTLAMAAGYRVDRIQAYLHAEDDPAGNGFQTLQALIAMGNGGVTGLGLGASRGKFFYIPESHTDGVFAIIGEEAGLIAAVTVLVLFVALMVRGYGVAARARDRFGQLLATGVTSWIILQALLNIGGITRVVPLTGVPLPFLSYGGNALAAEMLGIGILVSVSRFGADRGGFMDRQPARRDLERKIVKRHPE